MATSLIDADSLLAIDVGSITTRVMLFDVVEGRYRFLASGLAPTTVYAPFSDISEGIRNAIDQLQETTGRVLVGEDERLIIPGREDGSGVDTIAATLSVGPVLNVIAVGLLEDVSLQSVQQLARTSYARVVETIGLNDRRRTDQRIDLIFKHRPDLIIVAGGTNGGASLSVLKLMEAAGLASILLPEQQRPEVLFAGNQALKEEVKNSVERQANFHIAGNIRPTLEDEQLEPALAQMTSLYKKIRSKSVGGIRELDTLSGGGLLPASMGLGRMVRFLSQVYDPGKGVLGIDVGSSHTTVAAAFNARLFLNAYPEFGLGPGLAELLSRCQIGDIQRWLPIDLSSVTIREYLDTKAMYPGTIPATMEDLLLEHALARQVMRMAVSDATTRFDPTKMHYGMDLLPWFEPVVASGSVLTNAPKPAQALAMLLDGVQPTGITTIVLDQYHLMSSLGAAAAINPLLAVQVLESSAFTNLCTVISPVGEARSGTPILHVKLVHEDGHEVDVEIKQGNLDVLPLPIGQTARLQLQPLHRFDIGMGGPGRGGKLKVVGGSQGIIIDARGRPLHLPVDPGRRRELIQKWLGVLGC